VGSNPLQINQSINYTPLSAKQPACFASTNQKSASISLPLYARLSFLILQFGHPNNNWKRGQKEKLPTMQISPASFLLGQNIFSSNLLCDTLGFCTSITERQKFLKTH
jgi:hypothetical protein